jgi:triosephosphate isomerase
MNGRKPIVAGNWKMNKLIGPAIDLAAEVKRQLSGFDAADVVLCPPFTALKSVGDLIRFSNVRLGAQDVYWEAEGAYTGEVSLAMLEDLACDYVIVGHSERRAFFDETDEAVNRKARAVLGQGLKPIICVGETLDQREAGRTEEVVSQQVQHGLDGLAQGLTDAVIAYEPVWAIGTGRTATSAQAQEVHAFIRGLIGEMAGSKIAEATRIQYGGSVKPSNAAELFAQPDVDGGLIGGASLEADSFVRIVEATSIPSS